MSLYRHVRSKEELVTLMVDVATEPPTSAEDAAEGWRSGLERWSWDLLAVVRRHPWLLQVALPRVPFGPRRLAWLDRGLQALADTTLNEDEKAAIILLLNGYVFSEARVATEVGNPRQGSEAQSAATEQLEVLSALVDRQRFPALRRALDAGIFDPPGAGRDADFAFGLERFLDGVERLVTERADERQPPPGAAREGD